MVMVGCGWDCKRLWRGWLGSVVVVDLALLNQEGSPNVVAAVSSIGNRKGDGSQNNGSARLGRHR